MAPQAGQPIPGWSAGAQGVKDAPRAQGQRRPGCCAPHLGCRNPCQEQRGCATGSPRCPQQPQSHQSTETSFIWPRNQLQKGKRGISQHPATILGKRAQSRFASPFHQCAGKVQKDSEQPGLEGMRPRFCCHGTLKHWVPVAGEGTSQVPHCSVLTGPWHF